MMAIKSEPCELSQPNCDRTTSCKKSEALQDLSNKGRAKAGELFSCIRKGQYDEFVDLLESKPRADLNAFFDGNTALHYCLLMRRDISWCKQLVVNGANPNLSNLDGWHPIHLAAHSGSSDVMKYLINCNNKEL